MCVRVCRGRREWKEKSHGVKQYISLQRQKHTMFSIDLHMCFSDFSSLMFVLLGLGISNWTLRCRAHSGLDSASFNWHDNKRDFDTRSSRHWITFANGESNHVQHVYEDECSVYMWYTRHLLSGLCFLGKILWCTWKDAFCISSCNKRKTQNWMNNLSIILKLKCVLLGASKKQNK